MHFNGHQHSMTGAANAAAMAGASACLALRFGGPILWTLTAGLAMAATAIAWRPAAEDIRREALPWGLAGAVAAAGLAFLPPGWLAGAVVLGGLSACLFGIGTAVNVRAMRAERGQQKAPARAGG